MNDKNEIKRFIINNMQDNYYNIFSKLEECKSELTEQDFVSVYLDVCFSTSFYHHEWSLTHIASYYNLSKTFYYFQSETMKEYICSYNPTEEQLAVFINNGKIDYFLKKYFIENRPDLFNESSVYAIVLFATKYRNLYNNDFSHCFNIIKKISGVEKIDCSDREGLIHFIVERKGPFQYGSINNKFTTNQGIRYIAELVKFGVDVNQADKSGKMPLEFAIEKDEKQFIVSLVKYKPQNEDVLNGNLLFKYLNKIQSKNDNVLKYFLKNLKQEVLESYTDQGYKVLEILKCKLTQDITRSVIKRIIHIKNNKGESGELPSIKETIMKFKKDSNCRSVFIEEESFEIERRLKEVKSNKPQTMRMTRSARL